MSPKDPKRWIHPQAVPRGFLRLYILSLLSRKAETGYSIMQAIDEKTEGAWRPGPGTIYPLLRSLEKESLVRPAESGGAEGRIAYSATEAGKHELDEMAKTLASAGRRERVMMRLFADLLPPAVLTSIMLNRARDSSELFREKVTQLPSPSREEVLKEMSQVLEAQLDWIGSQLALKAKPSRRSR